MKLSPLLLLATTTALLAQLPPGALLPDILEQTPNHLHIQNEHKREMLRFTTGHVNLGAGHLQIRGGNQIAPCVAGGISYPQCTHAIQEILDGNGQVVATHPAGNAVFHPEHNHWHQSDVALFEVRAGSIDGPVVGSGVKVTYCLIDLEPVDYVKTTRSRTYWDCNADLQGISPGWVDTYHHATHGQELDITGVPAGIYYLTHWVNPNGNWLESNYNNNRAWVKFELVRKGANASVKVLETAPCDPGLTCPSPANPG